MAILNKPKVSSVSIIDHLGGNKTGKRGDIVNISITLSEPVSFSGNLTLKSFIPIFSNPDDSADLPISFTSINASSSANGKNTIINLLGTLPSGNASNLILTSLSLNGLTLVGNNSKLSMSDNQVLKLSTGYNLDNTPPSFTSGTAATVVENSSINKVIYTPTVSRDSGAVRYALAGTDSGLFNMSSKGVVTLKAAANFESKSTYAFSVIATDMAGNSAAQEINVAVTGVDEPTQLINSGIGAQAFIKKVSSIHLNVASDFRDPEGANITYASTQLPAGLTLSAGTLSGTPADTVKDGVYQVTITANDSNARNGKDASRVYKIGVFSAPKVLDISINDSSGNSAYGKASDTVTIKITMSEALSSTAGITTSNLTPVFKSSASGTIVSLSLASVSATTSADNKTLLTYSATLPEGVSANNLFLSGLTIADSLSLTGTISNQALATYNPNLATGYVLDTTAPVFGQRVATLSKTVKENLSVGSVFLSAKASDLNQVSYSLTGTDASAFAINNNGGLSFSSSPDFERQTSYSVTVIATDKAGNSSSKPVTVTVSNLDEPTRLHSNVSGRGGKTFYLGHAGELSIADDFVDPEAGSKTYNIVAGKLPAGFSLNTNSGLISGSASAQSVDSKVTIMAKDANKKNGLDATRIYQFRIKSQPDISGSDVYFSADTNDGVNVQVNYVFPEGSTRKLFKAENGQKTGNAITSVTFNANAESQSFHLTRSDFVGEIVDGKIIQVLAEYSKGDATPLYSSVLPITVDLTSPDRSLFSRHPALSHDIYLNAQETSMNYLISYPGIEAGDRIQLKFGEELLVGSETEVSQAHADFGVALIALNKDSLQVRQDGGALTKLADGEIEITAQIKDKAGNTGVSASNKFILDTHTTNYATVFYLNDSATGQAPASPLTYSASEGYPLSKRIGTANVGLKFEQNGSPEDSTRDLFWGQNYHFQFSITNGVIRKQVSGANVDAASLSLDMPLFKSLSSQDDLELSPSDQGVSLLTPYSWIINSGATSTLTVLISDIAGNSSQYVFSATQANAPTLQSSVVI